MDAARAPAENVNMAPVKKPKPFLQPHFMGQWREYRRMSQEDAAELMGISRTLLSKIEGAKSPWGQPVLQKAAKVYQCSIVGLLTINPLDDPDAADLDSILNEASPELRAKIAGYAQGLIDQ